MLILSGLSTSCSHITIPDAEYCGDKGALGAACFHTLSDQSRQLTQVEWDSERFGQLCSSAETFAEQKKIILKLCKVTKACSYQEKQLLEKFGAKIARFQSSVKSMEEE